MSAPTFITIATAIGPDGAEKPAGKLLSRDPEGNIAKKASPSARYRGKTVEVANVDSLAGILSNLRSSQLLVPGAIPGTTGCDFRIVSKRLLLDHGLPVDTPEPAWYESDGMYHVQWRAGYFVPSNLMLLEFDYKSSIPDHLAPLNSTDWLGKLIAFDRQLSFVRRLLAPSSGGRVLGATGAGFHAWVQVADPSDIPRYIRALHIKLILGGGGYVHHSGSSRAYYSLIDPSVGKPGRKVYAGPPAVTGDIQLREPDLILDGSVPLLDTSRLQVTDAEYAAFAELVGGVVQRGDSVAVCLPGKSFGPDFEVDRDDGGLYTVADFIASGDCKWRIQASWRGSTSMAATLNRTHDGGVMIYDCFGPTKMYYRKPITDTFSPVPGQAQGPLMSINGQAPQDLDGLSWTKRFKLTEGEMNGLVEPEWIYPDLIVQGHLVAIPAEPGAGKTTILMHIAEEIAQDYQVIYVNADTGASDAKHWQQLATRAGFDLLLPDMKAGLSMDAVVGHLIDMNQVDADYSRVVFVFDTLKKMTDVISKKSKELYKVLRGLTAKGATVVLLAHTNKYADSDGSPIFEGTGDLRSDVDDLIYLIPFKNKDGSMTVTTDPLAATAKRRGTHEPITFTINKDRTVTRADKVIDTGEIRKSVKQINEDAAIIEAITEAILAGSNKLTQILTYCKDQHKMGRRTVEKVLRRYQRPPHQRWELDAQREHNARVYTLLGAGDTPFQRTPLTAPAVSQDMPEWLL